jgi:membrane associated rhomboid family serine protease
LYVITLIILEFPMAIAPVNARLLPRSFSLPLIALIFLGAAGCAGRGGEVLKDGLIGAGGGAIVGAIVPGVSAGEGAAIGAAGGAAYGLLKDRKGRTIHKDDQGNKYWIDSKGRRRYY